MMIESEYFVIDFLFFWNFIKPITIDTNLTTL